MRWVGPPAEMPVFVAVDCLEELFAHPDRVVRVLPGDSRIRFAIEIAWIAGSDQRGDLLLLVDLPGDELFDVRVIDVDDDHLRGAAGGATTLDSACGAIPDPQKAHQPGRCTAARERLALAPNRREIRPRSGS